MYAAWPMHLGFRFVIHPSKPWKSVFRPWLRILSVVGWAVLKKSVLLVSGAVPLYCGFSRRASVVNSFSIARSKGLANSSGNGYDQRMVMGWAANFNSETPEHAVPLSGTETR